MSSETLSHTRVMCITQDGLPQSHVEQARRLVDAGAYWIQLRMKNASMSEWVETATEVVEICRAKEYVACIINDSVDVAIASGAHGVHLGAHDEDWVTVRHYLGQAFILGGTVNNAADATRAAESGCLTYVGLGPWRFTANKRNLAPVLGPEGMRAVVARLGSIPAWAVGGIGASDMPAIRAVGAVGAAVSSALFRGGKIEENYRAIAAAWGPPKAGLPS